MCETSCRSDLAHAIENVNLKGHLLQHVMTPQMAKLLHIHPMCLSNFRGSFWRFYYISALKTCVSRTPPRLATQVDG